MGIYHPTLEDFLRKRAGSLPGKPAKGNLAPAADRRTVAEVFAAVRRTVQGMLAEQADCYANLIHPLLARSGVHLLTWQQLDVSERQTADRYFQANVFPVLTPLAVDSGSPFTFI